MSQGLLVRLDQRKTGRVRVAGKRLGLLALIAVLCCVAVVLHVTALPAPRPAAESWQVWLVLAAAFLAAERLVVHLHVGRDVLIYSFSEVPLIVGLALFDPTVVVACRLGAAVAVLAARHGHSIKFTFNVAHFWLETALAVFVWHSVLGPADPVGPRGWLAALAVLVVTDVYSAGAVGLAMRLSGARPDRTSLPQFFAGSAMALANVSVAVLFITLIRADWRTGWTLIVLSGILAAAYRGYGSLRRRHDSLEKLAGFANDVDGRLSVEQAAREFVDRIASLLDAEIVELTWSPPGGSGDAVAVVGGLGRATEVRPGTCGLVDVVQPSAEEPLLAQRSSRDPDLRARLGAVDLRDAVVAPLNGQDGINGRLLVGNRIGDTSTFELEDMRVLQAAANQAAVALTNSGLADRLRREAADREHEAMHDPLTGLANRRLFRERVVEQLGDDVRLAVLLLDLDRFKEVNDTLGHHTGDQLLREVAARLLATLPDGATAARLGGDEFAILLPGADEAGAAQEAHRLRSTLASPCAAGRFRLRSDASIGVAVAPRDGHDPDLLLQRADVAMYTAKEDRTGFSMYTAERDNYSPRRLAIFADLQTAVETGALHVEYQPKVRLATGTVTGVEALVRWHHPQYGLIPPNEFLPIAEHTDLMLPLTRLVLRRAVSECATWEQHGLHLDVAVNISPRTLLEPSLPELVRDVLNETGLATDRLTLEITEDTVMTEPARAIAVMDELRMAGVRLSIDDFGTGHSSLSYVRQLPATELKIDRSFVSELSASSDTTVVEATVELAHRLGLQVVAEGVETPASWHELQRIGCDIAQGYLISRPLAGEAFVRWSAGWQAPASGQHLAAVAALPV